MKDTFKAIILPLNDLFLNNFKGYTVNFNPLSKKEIAKIHRLEKYRKWYLQKKWHPFKFAFVITILPFFIVSVIISLLIDLFSFKITSPDNFTFKKFFPSIEKLAPYEWPENYNSKLRRKYGAQKVDEDIPAIFEKAAKFHIKIILYGFIDLDHKQVNYLNERKSAGHITNYFKLQSFADLGKVIEEENINILNSHCIVNDPEAIEHGLKLGFSFALPGQNNSRIHLMGEMNKYDAELLSSQSFKNSYGFLFNKMEYYLFARYNSFFKKNTILFIEDKYDKSLNEYISQNILDINKRLAEKNFQLLHLPSINFSDPLLNVLLFRLIEQRIPALSSLSIAQKISMVNDLLVQINPTDFYNNLHLELGLPYYKRPCLLRPLPDGLPENENRFTYAYIPYNNASDLDKFFDDYINQLKLPDKDDYVFYQLSRPKFRVKDDIEVNQSDELIGTLDDKSQAKLPIKKAIDDLLENGEHTIMAQAIVYLLLKLKEQNPAMIEDVFPTFSKFQLLKDSITLSPILVDRHYKIFLPAFGHQEVKMHALPKALYLFYLRHPEGVAFKELYLHHPELLRIYYKVTNKSDKQEIIKAIDDLVDMTNPSINQKTSRIRESFRQLMDEETASHYYISGNPGEPKKILLSPDLIQFIPDPFE